MSAARVAIVGISGRMGSELRTVAADFGLHVAAGVSRSTDFIDAVAIYPRIADLDKNQVDLVIDFSLPELTVEVVQWCAQARKPLVSGVTGVGTPQHEAFRQGAQEIPILWAPNMSLGVAIVARMIGNLSSLADFDFQVEEFHHNKKKDRPSGTALFLQEKLIQAVNKPVPQPVAIRGGGIFGVHKVFAMGEEEMVTLEHAAMNRRVFARGACRAARWILSQPPGLYQLDDTL